MKKLIEFGPAGIPASAKPHNIAGGLNRVKELGLDSDELEFTYSVTLSEPAAREVGVEAKKLGIGLSVHAPYYINLNSVEKKKIEASKKRILHSAIVGEAAGARIVCFHPGFYGKDSKENAFETVERELIELSDSFREKKLNIKIGLETTGKNSQFGSLEEILELGRKVRNVFPYVDWAHLHARCNGCLKTKNDFIDLIKLIKKAGPEFLDGLFMHVAGINYSEKGERNHLNLNQSDFNYKALLQALHEMKVKGNIICESPNLEEDALLLKKYYSGLLE